MTPLIARQTLANFPVPLPFSVRRVGIGCPAILASGSNGTFTGNDRAPVSVQGLAELVMWSSRSSRQERGCGGWELSNTGGCFDDALALLASAPALPKLVVLDLDFTIWPFYWLDGTRVFVSLVHSYSRSKSQQRGPPAVYPQVVDIVRALAAQNVKMAVASRSPAASFAKGILDQLSIGKHFDAMEIFFTVYSKSAHFVALREKTGIPYSAMLFFDDERKNVNIASKLGVSSVLVTEGLDITSLKHGLKIFAASVP